MKIETREFKYEVEDNIRIRQELLAPKKKKFNIIALIVVPLTVLLYFIDKSIVFDNFAVTYFLLVFLFFFLSIYLAPLFFKGQAEKTDPLFYEPRKYIFEDEKFKEKLLNGYSNEIQNEAEVEWNMIKYCRETQYFLFFYINKGLLGKPFAIAKNGFETKEDLASLKSFLSEKGLLK